MTDHSPFNPAIFDDIADNLVEPGLIIIPNFLPETLTSALYDHVASMAGSEFKQAGIGRQQDLQLNQHIRSDKTHWLTNSNECEREYLSLMDECRQQLNQHLYLGLKDYESHFAHYAQGDFYKRHVDAFKGQSNRIVTTVFYLNPNWSESDGGDLVIYAPTDQEKIIEKVSPQFGTMVLFMSQTFPHEVLAAKRDRYSISGWFRIDQPLL